MAARGAVVVVVVTGMGRQNCKAIWRFLAAFVAELGMARVLNRSEIG